MTLGTCKPCLSVWSWSWKKKKNDWFWTNREFENFKKYVKKLGRKSMGSEQSVDLKLHWIVKE